MTIIRVADAPLLDHRQLPSTTSSGTALERPAGTGRQLFFIFVLALLLFSFVGVFSPRGAAAPAVYVYTRYLLWPMAALGIAIHLQRFGTRPLLDTIKTLLPFLLIGIFATLLGYTWVGSAKQIVFWLFGICIGAVIGRELPNRAMQRYLLLFFLISCLLSIGVAIGDPSYGTASDNRSSSGVSWRGAFAGKNLLGEVAAYLLVLAYIVPVRPALRMLGFGAAAVCLVFAGSQGAIVTAVGVIALVAGIAILRRAGLSSGVQATILGFVTLAFAIGLVFGLGPLLGALGRDPTLTGRTVIWSLFGPRAMLFWLHGAGPGTFTDTSPFTADLTPALAAFGHIVQPHNMYIAALGETGIFGAAAMVLPLCYFAFVLPFTHPTNQNAVPVAAMAMMMLIGGLNETHEVFGSGFRIVLVMLTYGAMLAGERRIDPEPAEAKPIDLRTERTERFEALT